MDFSVISLRFMRRRRNRPDGGRGWTTGHVDVDAGRLASASYLHYAGKGGVVGFRVDKCNSVQEISSHNDVIWFAGIL